MNRITDEERDKVLAALADPAHTWRTIWGVARDAGMEPQRVEEICTHSRAIVVTDYTSRDGARLYGSYAHLKARLSFGQKFKLAFVNRIYL